MLPCCCSTFASLQSGKELPYPVISLAGPLSKNGSDASSPVLYNDLFPEFPCDGELIPVDALSTEEEGLLWCSGCGTEFPFTPDST